MTTPIARARFVVGIDPDAQASGVAVYQDGKLVQLATMTTVKNRAAAAGLSECAGQHRGRDG